MRKDLGVPYAAVQGGHALAAWMIANPTHHWQNSTLAYVVVPDSIKLDNLCRKLKSYGHEYSEFLEPDINNERTAIACYTDSKVFSGLKKLGE